MEAVEYFGMTGYYEKIEMGYAAYFKINEEAEEKEAVFNSKRQAVAWIKKEILIIAKIINRRPRH